MAQKKMKFQEAMNRLDEIVTRLNADDLELEEAMDLFIEGSKLAKQCEKQLQTFENKVNEMTKKESDHE